MKKTLSILLTGTLLSLSFGPPAHAALGRAVLGSNSGSSAASVAASGAASMPLRGGVAPVRTNLQALSLNSSLSSIRTIGLQSSVNKTASVLPAASIAVPFSAKATAIAAPVEQGASAAAESVGHAAATKREVESKSAAVTTALKSVGKIGSVAAEGAYSLGRRIDSILFHNGPIRGGLFDGSSDAAFERSLEQARAPRFAEDWLDLADSLRAAEKSAEGSMFDPNFVFAESDIEDNDGVLRVSETRFGYFEFKRESWIRVSVKPGASVGELTVQQDQSRRMYGMNFPGRMTTEPTSKLTLKKAIERARGQVDGYTPKRVLFMQPAGYLDTAKGSVFRMIDAGGVILDVDANTGQVYGTPQLRDDPASRHFEEGTVPAPDSYAGKAEVVERNPQYPGLSGRAQLGIGLLTTAVLAGLSAALAVVTGWHFVAASMAVMVVSVLAALGTNGAGMQYDDYTKRSTIVSHKTLDVSYGMMLGTILFGVGFLSMAYLGVTPGMLVSGLGFGAVGGVMFGKPELMPNPGALYERAYYEALEAARKLGYEEIDLDFNRATAAWPLSSTDRRWSFTFSADKGIGEFAGMDYHEISVDFSGGMITRIPRQLDSRISSFHLKGRTGPERALVDNRPATMKAVLRVGPEQAADVLRRKYKDFQVARAGVALEPGAGAAGLIYRFYDEAGNIAEVDPTTAEARLVKQAPAKPKGLGGLIGSALTSFGATFLALLTGTAGLAMLDVSFTASILLPVLAAGALSVYLWTGSNPVRTWAATAEGGNRRAIAAGLVLAAALLYLALGLSSPLYTIQAVGVGLLGLGV